MLSLLAPFALVALTSLQAVKAIPPALYVGCARFTPDDYVTTDSPDITYPIDCANACFNYPDGPYMYSYFQADQPTRKRQAMSTCRCSNSPVDAGYIVESTNSEGQCETYQWSSYITRSSYTFQGCFTEIGTQDCAPAGVLLAPDVNSPEDCLQTCSSYEVAAIQPGTPMSESQYTCTCGSTKSLDGSNQGTCTYNSYFYYTHDPSSSFGSGFAKRQLKERLIKIRNGKKALCPSGLTACKVSTSSDSFKCIDTSVELESCGGCINGEYNNANATLGQDCSALPGLARGGVTCSAGSCQAFACKKGWVLSSAGFCVEK